MTDLQLLDQQAEWHVPPGACLAVREGSVESVACEGFARLEPAEALTADHWHDLASVSKLVTLLTLDRLVTAGKLQWETTLAELLPDAGNFGTATIDQVLRHRAGFAPWAPLYLEAASLSDPIGAILASEPIAQPGTQTTYSDLGMQVAARVIAEVCQLSFVDAVRQWLPELAGLIAHEGEGVPHPVAASSLGDRIEQDMVATGVPYEVTASDEGFEWRTHVLQGETSDCNAHYVYGRATGHAGWFANAQGALAIAELLLELNDSYSANPVDGIARGIRVYDIEWNGCSRTLVGHPGFTGAFVGASPATGGQPPVTFAWLSNRLHGSVPVTATLLAPVDRMWRHGLAVFDNHLHSGGIS